jgi:hypothetical protein
MNLSVSPQIRIVALVGLVAVLGLMATAVALSRHGTSSPSGAAAPRVAPHHVRPAGPVTAPQTPSKPAVPRHRVNPFVAAAVAQGWPHPLATMFATNRVVVVEVYSSDSGLDLQALDEATAAARLVGAGLYAVDVGRKKTDRVARVIARKLGVLTSPATLVLRRPGSLFVRLDGFQDQTSVAQAATNAASPAG